MKSWGRGSITLYLSLVKSLHDTEKKTKIDDSVSQISHYYSSSESLAACDSQSFILNYLYYVPSPKTTLISQLS